MREVHRFIFGFSHIFRYVLVSPKERKVVIVESALCPTEIRETLAKVLFRHFEVGYSSIVNFNIFQCFTNSAGIVCVVHTYPFGGFINTSGGNSFSY